MRSRKDHESSGTVLHSKLGGGHSRIPTLSTFETEVHGGISFGYEYHSSSS